jgi:hypothetical protein
LSASAAAPATLDRARAVAHHALMVRIPDDAIGDRDMARAYMAAIDIFRHNYPQVSLASKPWRWLTDPAAVALFGQPAFMDRMDVDPRDSSQVVTRLRRQTPDASAAVFVEVQPRLEGSPGRAWPSVYVPLAYLKNSYRAMRDSSSIAAFERSAATVGPSDSAAEQRRLAYVTALEDDDVAFARQLTAAYLGPDPSLAEQAREAAREVGEALGAAVGGTVGAVGTGIGAALTAAWRGIPTPLKIAGGALGLLIVYNQLSPLLRSRR